MKDTPLNQPHCSYEPCIKRVFTRCDQCGKPYCSDHVRLRAPRRYVCSTCIGEQEPILLPEGDQHQRKGAPPMPTLSLWALGLMVLTALVLIPANLNCGGGVDCLNYLLWQALAVLLGLIGFILALIATIRGCVRAAKRRQWGWLVGLVIGVLAPFLAAGVLDTPLAQVYPNSELLPILPLSAGLVLTPVVALIYSWRSPPGTAAERSVPLPALQTLEEPAPPPLDAP